MTFKKNLQFQTLIKLAIVSLFSGTIILTPPAYSAAKSTTVPHKTWQRATEIALPTASPLGQMDTALKFILVTGIHKNLSLLLLHSVKDQPSVQAAVQKHGMDVVQNTVVQAIRAAKAKHGAEWNEMLARIYRGYFTDNELRSIMTERESSPYFAQLIDKHTLIATDTKTQGQSIFAAAKSDILENLARADR